MKDFVVLEGTEQLFRHSVKHLIATGREAIADHGFFYLALSGGSTPKNIYHLLAQPEFRSQLDWSRVLLFWSDERCVPPTDSESNYRMAYDAGLETLPLLPEHIFRMHGESDPKQAGDAYDQLIQKIVPDGCFDLVMLGMGTDGHTASLFPHTAALQVTDKLATANYIPDKKSWRITLTLPCINKARIAVFYVTGDEKAQRVAEVFAGAKVPAGLVENGLWFLDKPAASLLN